MVVERFVSRRSKGESLDGDNKSENVNMSNDKQINCHRKLPGFQQKGRLC